MTAGWTTTVWIPGTARDVELRVRLTPASSGIGGRKSETYTAVGTKLIGRQFEVSG